MFRIALLTVFLASPLLGQPSYGPSAIFEPAGANFVNAGNVRRLLSSEALKDPPDTVQLVEAILREQLHALLPADDGGVISFSAWLASAPTEARQRLLAAYRERYDGPAREALELVRQRPAATAEDFVGVSRRYPWSSSAPFALQDAGDRLAAIGDATSAGHLYALAAEQGLKPDEPRLLTLALGRALAGEPAADVPPAVRAKLPDLSPTAYRGPVTFDAAWYNRPEAVGWSRFVPYATGDGASMYLVGPRQVSALKENGQPVWRWFASDIANRASPDRPHGRGRGPAFVPAVYNSPAGPQVLLTRQPRGASKDFCLRAFRASDGKLLWTTEGHAALDNLSFASNPAVAGRYVYAVAVEFAASSGTLVLVALDLTDGRQIFRTPLGTMLDVNQKRSERLGWDGFWEQSEPAVHADGVYVTPNVGVAFAVDRFTGHVRWGRAYVDPAATLPLGRIPRGRGDGGAVMLPMPSDANVLSRYRNTPHVTREAVVVAPADAPQTLALDPATGRVLWTAPITSSPTLVGGTPTTAILAGYSVQSINAASGKEQWKYTPTRPAFISGPPALVNGQLYVPLSTVKIECLSPETGQPEAPKLKHPNFRQLINSEPGKRAIDDMLMLRTIGPPTARP